MDRLRPEQVLYVESGGAARCGRCEFYLKDTRECHLLVPGYVVDARDGACMLFVAGVPKTAQAHGEPGKNLTPDEAGYGADMGLGGYRCGNCEYGAAHTHCAHPALRGWRIDPLGGCCTAWERDEAVESMRKVLTQREAA